jgi:parallel beta-helix repeat protein
LELHGIKGKERIAMIKHFLFLLLLPIVADVSAFAKSPTVVFSRDTVLASSIEVPEDAVYSIKPGVSIRFSGYYKFIVRGLLIAEGTAEKPITFTGVDRPRGSMEAPCWYGVMIMGEKSNGLFRHCRFEGAFRNLAWESKPVFDSCEFVGNRSGLYCAKNAVAHVKNCGFYRNVYGITADFADPLLLDNVISDNTIGIYLQTGSRPALGKNIITHNQTDVRTEPSLKGDTGASAMRNLWERMDQLH